MFQRFQRNVTHGRCNRFPRQASTGLEETLNIRFRNRGNWAARAASSALMKMSVVGRFCNRIVFLLARDFPFFIFFFLDTICLDIVVCIGLSRPLCLAEEGNESQFVFGDVWRRRMMFGDDSKVFFFICLDFEIIFARIWLCFAFEDFELFSSNCKETIELKNVKWFSNDFLWFKESEKKNRYVKINIF